MKIEIPKTWLGEEIEGSMERVLSREEPELSPAETTRDIIPRGDFWRVGGVQYRGEIQTVDLSKTLLDNGNIRTQDDWAKYSESAMARDEFYTPDYPIFYGVLKALYLGKDDSTKAAQIVEAQNFLRDTSRAKWLTTLTRIIYHPNGLDNVVHNYGLPNVISEQVGFTGPDRSISSNDNDVCQALLGTTDSPKQINEVFQWLNGTDAFIWRLDSRPEKTSERVAWFYAGSVRANLSANWDPTNSYSSLGVRAVRRASR